MKPIFFSFEGIPPSKKNSKRIGRNRSTGNPMILSSEDYESWYNTHMYTTFRKIHALYGMVKVHQVDITFYPANKRKRDLTNAAEGLMDAMVDAEIIKDDNMFEVPHILLGNGGLVDTDSCRTEVTLHRV